jgi:hypothetical protein
VQARARKTTLVWAVLATTLVSAPWSHAGDPPRVGAAQCVRTGDVRNHKTVKSGFFDAHARGSALESRWRSSSRSVGTRGARAGERRKCADQTLA